MFHCKFATDEFDAAIFSFIELALGAGWTMPMSSDGIAYEIKHDGNNVNGLGNNLAWFVLRTRNRLELLFQRGKKPNMWFVSHSDKPYVGGTNLSKPQAADEIKLFHNGFDGPDKFDVDKWCFGIDDEFDAFYFVGIKQNIDFGIVYDMTLETSAHGNKKKFAVGNLFKTNVDILRPVRWPTGSVYNGHLVVENILVPWTAPEVPTPFSPPLPIVETKTKQSIPVAKPKSSMKYKMIGKLVVDGEASYHGWVVSGSPDFKGEYAKVSGLEHIYVADKWKG
jgi:hypothetical protein